MSCFLAILDTDIFSNHFFFISKVHQSFNKIAFIRFVSFVFDSLILKIIITQRYAATPQTSSIKKSLIPKEVDYTYYIHKLKAVKIIYRDQIR